MWDSIGLACAVGMPFFNIPLIFRILRRRSSEDISLIWVTGVWICILGMLPASFNSHDRILRFFTFANTIAFTLVFITVYAFHPLIRSLKSKK